MVSDGGWWTIPGTRKQQSRRKQMIPGKKEQKTTKLA